MIGLFVVRSTLVLHSQMLCTVFSVLSTFGVKYHSSFGMFYFGMVILRNLNIFACVDGADLFAVFFMNQGVFLRYHC